MMDLKNKTAIVNGAANGIWKELSIELARHCGTIMLVDVKERLLSNTGGCIQQALHKKPYMVILLQ